MGVYLFNDMSVEECRWSVVAASELRLLSSSPGQIDDEIGTLKDEEFNNDVTSWGWENFITLYKLRAGSFIQNDTIKIRAHLTVKSFERIVE